MKRSIAIAVLLLALVGVALPVLAQVGGPYDLSWFTVDGGGGESASGTYALQGSVGQVDASGELTSATYALAGGFWPGVAVKPLGLAVTRLVTGVDIWLPEEDKAGGLAAGIDQVVDPQTQQPLPGVLISSYQATFQYNGTLLNVLDVRHKAPFSPGTENIDNPGGITQFAASAPGGAPWPIDPLAFVALRLTGCTTDTATLTPSFAAIQQEGGGLLGIDQPSPKTLRRGDAKAGDGLSVGDVLFIAQYIVGLRDLTTMNAVNAASVKYDGAFDVITMADALQLAQLLVGLRDGCFGLITGATPPVR